MTNVSRLKAEEGIREEESRKEAVADVKAQ